MADNAADRAQFVIGLTAVILALDGRAPKVLVVKDETVGKQPGRRAALPFGPFDPKGHRTFELALRAFVRDQTGFEIGYVEQLYTFGDRGREAPRAHVADGLSARVVSVGYLALAAEPGEAPGGTWADWYQFFPWEDWRCGRPDALDQVLAPRLRAWSDEAEGQGRRAARWARARVAFGLDGAEWNEERVLDRYELLYEAGLAPEAEQDDKRSRGETPPPLSALPLAPGLGAPMASDHRRILATAIQRIRAKIKYRPVIFELVASPFTLSALQTAVEAILGLSLHKQNFRRALAGSGLVEGTGEMETGTGGRPAELYRFKSEILAERPSLGVAAPRVKEG
ncbi:MAG: NAD regulator [Maricaulaceae bacterium]